MAKRRSDLGEYGYLYDPSTAWARTLTSVGQDVIAGAERGLANRRARQEAEIESERLRAMRAKRNELLDIVQTSTDPEQVARAKEELATSVSGYEFVPQRPQKGRLLDWAAGVNRQPRKLFSDEELMDIDEGIAAMENTRRAKEEARQIAEWEARLPYEMSGEYVSKYGKEPTSVGKGGVSWDAYAEVRPGLEQEKVDISRLKAERGGGGGGAAAGKPPKLSDVKNYMSIYTRPLTQEEKTTYGVAGFSTNATNWLNNAMLDASSRGNIESAQASLDSWIASLDSWGNSNEARVLRMRLQSARAGLQSLYGKMQEEPAGGGGAGAGAESEDDFLQRISGG